jgi:hypothetical protein
MGVFIKNLNIDNFLSQIIIIFNTYNVVLYDDIIKAFRDNGYQSGDEYLDNEILEQLLLAISNCEFLLLNHKINLFLKFGHFELKLGQLMTTIVDLVIFEIDEQKPYASKLFFDLIVLGCELEEDNVRIFNKLKYYKNGEYLYYLLANKRLSMNIALDVFLNYDINILSISLIVCNINISQQEALSIMERIIKSNFTSGDIQFSLKELINKNWDTKTLLKMEWICKEYLTVIEIIKQQPNYKKIANEIINILNELNHG